MSIFVNVLCVRTPSCFWPGTYAAASIHTPWAPPWAAWSLRCKRPNSSGNQPANNTQCDNPRTIRNRQYSMMIYIYVYNIYKHMYIDTGRTYGTYNITSCLVLCTYLHTTRYCVLYDTAYQYYTVPEDMFQAPKSYISQAKPYIIIGNSIQLIVHQWLIYINIYQYQQDFYMDW